MRYSGDEDRRSARGRRQHIGKSDQSIRHVSGRGHGSDVEGVHYVSVSTWAPQEFLPLEAARSDHMQVGKDLERRTQPGIHLSGHGSGDRQRRGNSAAHR